MKKFNLFTFAIDFNYMNLSWHEIFDFTIDIYHNLYLAD